LKTNGSAQIQEARVYRFSWDSFITDDVMGAVREAAGLSTDESLEPLRPLISQIFRRVGGVPLSAHSYDSARRAEIGKRLLWEATAHAIHQTHSAPTPRGYLLNRRSKREFEAVVTSTAKVPVNTAPMSVINGLHGISDAVAHHIIEERQKNGSFRSLEDLDQRIVGLGEKTVSDLAGALRFDFPQESFSHPAFSQSDLIQILSYLFNLQKGATPFERISAALDQVAVACADEPHPSSIQLQVRDYLPPASPPDIPAEWIGILLGNEYFRLLPELMLTARVSIEVCMFHIAFQSAKHPTRKLLDALIGAQARGVTVRVLLDQDRPTDPYRSTIINAPAIEFLKTNGVSVKSDQAERLTHSKFIIIDSRLVIIGSHNWSAGSYFHFDDLSLAIASPALGIALRSRFDALESG
jgi:hypothetical protein